MTWPCSTCDAPGVRNVGTSGYCSTHLHTLYLTFSPEAFALSGVGLPCGLVRPEYGPAIEDLRCCACAATWCGVAGDPCGWCQRSREIRLAHQAELVLTPPDVDPDDIRHGQMVEAWSRRLRVAIDAGLIDEREAVTVLRREAKRAT